jgi:sterol desaturase/sphingolipid hydroxylase (fatty acid hydroxylase superfamily)
MANIFNGIEPLLEKLEDYGKTSFELYKLQTISKAAKVASTLVSRIAVIFVLAVFIFFASIGLALWLGELLGKVYYGFLVVAAFYLLLGGVLYFILYNTVKRMINNSIIFGIFNK